MLHCSIDNSENEGIDLSELFHLVKTVLSELPNNIDKKIKDIALVTNEEKERVLEISRGEELPIEVSTFFKVISSSNE